MVHTIAGETLFQDKKSSWFKDFLYLLHLQFKQETIPMRQLTVLLFSFFLSILAFSQKPKIQWGDEFKLHKGSTGLEVVYSDNSGVYLQESHYAMKSYFVIGASFRNSSTLIKLDKNLSELYSNDFNKELKGKQFEQFFMLQNKMLVLASDYNKREKLLTLLAAEVDKSTGQLSGEWETLTEFQKDDKKDDIKYRVALNADSTKMVIVSSVEGKSKNTYKVQEFDKDYKASEPVTISNEFDPKTFQLEDVLYSDQKKITMVGRIYQYEEGKKKKSKFLDFQNYNIRMYDETGKQIAEVNTEINGKWLMSTKLVQKKDKDIVLAAFYSNAKKGKTIDGMLIQRIDPETGKVISTNEKEMNTSILSTVSDSADDSNDDETKAERKERENLDKIKDDGEGFSRYMQFRDIFYTPDNGLIILAEKYHHYYYTSSSYVASGGTGGGYWQYSTYSMYECGDLMMCKVDVDGNVKWLQVLPKAQKESIEVQSDREGITTSNYFLPTNRPFYSGFGAIENKNSLFILFNDNPKNSGVTQPGQKVKTAVRFGKSDCFLLTLNEATGKYSRDVFFSNTDVPTAMPRLGSVTGDIMYIVGKDDRLLGKSKIAVARITVD
ncbi:MAG: hypothetical protein ABI261_04950 [Ginsengibacter sp.]